MTINEITLKNVPNLQLIDMYNKSKLKVFDLLNTTQKSAFIDFIAIDTEYTKRGLK